MRVCFLLAVFALGACSRTPLGSARDRRAEPALPSAACADERSCSLDTASMDRGASRACFEPPAR